MTIIAKYSGKKYKCKVRVCSDMDADKVTMTYANDIFTENLYSQVKKIRIISSERYVEDTAAIKQIYSEFASWNLTKHTGDEGQQLIGGWGFEIVLASGKTIVVSSSRENACSINGELYNYPKFNSEIAALIRKNEEW